jgi:hypothetical protein
MTCASLLKKEGVRKWRVPSRSRKVDLEFSDLIWVLREYKLLILSVVNKFIHTKFSRVDFLYNLVKSFATTTYN